MNNYFIWILYLILLAFSTVSMLVGEFVVGGLSFCLLLIFINANRVKKFRNDFTSINNHMFFNIIFSILISCLGAAFPTYSEPLLYIWGIVYMSKSYRIDKDLKKEYKTRR